MLSIDKNECLIGAWTFWGRYRTNAQFENLSRFTDPTQRSGGSCGQDGLLIGSASVPTM